MSLKMPNKLVVKWENEDTNSPWLSAAEDTSELAEIGETTTVAEYGIVRVFKVRPIVVEVK